MIALNRSLRVIGTFLILTVFTACGRSPKERQAARDSEECLRALFNGSNRFSEVPVFKVLFVTVDGASRREFATEEEREMVREKLSAGLAKLEDADVDSASQTMQLVGKITITTSAVSNEFELLRSTARRAVFAVKYSPVDDVSTSRIYFVLDSDSVQFLLPEKISEK
jgi:hypothetical protein